MGARNRRPDPGATRSICGLYYSVAMGHRQFLRALVALVSTAAAQFPFGEPAPPSKPPGMGSLIGEVQIIKEPLEVEALLASPVVSLVMFTDEEDGNEANWFLLFSIMVEKSIDLASGDARVTWAMVDTAMLRQREAAHVDRPPGIWLFCHRTDDSGVRLPMSVTSQDAVRQAGQFILDSLAAAHAQVVDGVWQKANADGAIKERAKIEL